MAIARSTPPSPRFRSSAATRQAYGAVQTGVAIGWNGTLTNTRVWHATRQAIAAFPVDELTIDGAIVRGDRAVLERDYENPAGIWLTNYAAKRVIIRRADIQGLRVGVFSPFTLSAETEPGRGDGTVTVEDSYFRSYVGVAIGTAYARAGRMDEARDAFRAAIASEDRYRVELADGTWEDSRRVARLALDSLDRTAFAAK